MSEDKHARLVQVVHELYPSGGHIETFAEAVLLRPRMYTMNGTFEEAIVFLHGFYNGMSAHNKYPKVQADADCWFAFIPHLAQHIGLEKSWSYAYVFPHFQDTHPDELSALIELVRLWHAFRRQYNGDSSLHND